MWITQDENKANRFHVDADAAYGEIVPIVRKALGVDEIDQYVLEISHNFIKAKSMMFASQQQNELANEIVIKGDSGYKERWGWKHHKPGKHAELRQKDEMKFARQCAKEARELFKKVYGFYPS